MVLCGRRWQPSQEGDAPSPGGTHACDGGQAARVQGEGLVVPAFAEDLPGERWRHTLLVLLERRCITSIGEGLAGSPPVKLIQC